MSDPFAPPGSSPVQGGQIADLRRAASLTQPELAVRAGVSTSTVYRAEQSDASIGPRTVARLAAALSVDPSEIYDGEVLPRAGQPVSADRAEEQHREVLSRLDGIQTALTRLSAAQG